MDIFRNILLVIVSPKYGWDEVNNSSIATQDLLARAFYPLLALLAISEFVPMLFDSTITLATSLMLAITSFSSYFITLYFTSFLLDGFYPELNRTNSFNSRHNDFIIYCLIFLVLLQLLDNLLPTHFAPLYFLVFYLFYIVYCGCEFLALERPKVRKFVVITSLVLICTPVVIQLLLKGIFL